MVFMPQYFGGATERSSGAGTSIVFFGECSPGAKTRSRPGTAPKTTDDANRVAFVTFPFEIGAPLRKAVSCLPKGRDRSLRHEFFEYFARDITIGTHPPAHMLPTSIQ